MRETLSGVRNLGTECPSGHCTRHRQMLDPPCPGVDKNYASGRGGLDTETLQAGQRIADRLPTIKKMSKPRLVVLDPGELYSLLPQYAEVHERRAPVGFREADGCLPAVRPAHVDLYLVAYARFAPINVDGQQRGVTPFERVEIFHLLEFPKPIQQNDRITAAIIAAACT